MHGTLLGADGSSKAADAAAVRDAIDHGEPFWLDLADLDDEVLTMLQADFKVHPLTIEDVCHFGQRPKVDEYEGYDYLVILGPDPDGPDTIEVHFIYSEKFLISIHRQKLSFLDDVRTRAVVARQHGHANSIYLLYRVLDAIIDGFFPVLDQLDDAIDAMEDEILKQPTDEQLGVLFDMKRRLVAYRKAVTPARDLFAGIAAGATDLPGMTDDVRRYFQDLYDHLIRISDLVDSYRDLLSGTVDTHLSVVSNRLNVVMKQLTIIATIFLPLSFLTGFFGQNFSALVSHITGAAVFWGAGIGLDAVAVLALLVFFKRRGWL